jgi:hypothetical protein
MPAPKLSKAQREQLLGWIAEGLRTDEINRRAGQGQPAWSVSRQTVDQYRKRYQVRIDEITQAADTQALNSGYARKAQRVELLNQLAETLADELFKQGKLWVKRTRGVGRGETVTEQEFNGAEVAQLRGTLEDLAAEVGDRAGQVEHKGSVTFIWDVPTPPIRKSKQAS